MTSCPRAVRDGFTCRGNKSKGRARVRIFRLRRDSSLHVLKGFELSCLEDRMTALKAYLASIPKASFDVLFAGHLEREREIHRLRSHESNEDSNLQASENVVTKSEA